MKYHIWVIIEAQDENSSWDMEDESLHVGEYPTLEKAREVRDFIAEGSN